MELRLENVALPDVDVAVGDDVVVEMSGRVGMGGVVEVVVVTARGATGGALGFTGEELSGTRRDVENLD